MPSLKKALISCILFLGLVFQPERQPAFAQPDALLPDHRIQLLIDQVTQKRVRQAIEQISGETPVLVGGEEYFLANRYNFSGVIIEKAAEYLYEQFSASGLQPAYHEYLMADTIHRNILADQVGFSPGNGVYLVTSHLDVFGASPIAYGADDNASGVAGVLIASQVLSQEDFSSGIRYIAFTGEEAGLLGSTAYASLMNSVDADIRGVINLDMIAYNTPDTPRAVELHTRLDQPGDQAIAQLFSDVVQAYDISLVPEILTDSMGRSDHVPFWQNGFAGVFGSEDFSEDLNPYYHKTTDRVSNLDIAYTTSFIQAVVGTLAHLAEIVEIQSTYFPVVSR